jgi:N6-L-threonylcarbamoyladenine synthase
MIILGIETSCDETGAALVERRSDGLLYALTNEVTSSLSLHAKTGGIIPENAGREQLKYILPVIKKAKDEKSWEDIDAIAVTVGPGLIGSLLVGVETARTIAYTLNKPIIPVNHLYGHIFANFICLSSKQATQNLKNPRGVDIQFPALALVVSGGHTDLVLMKSYQRITVIGGTRDDAAGEAFDKIGRLLGLPYPAGPLIAKLAEKGNPKTFSLPRPLIGSDDFDFSFSGLKTAVLREVKKINQLNNETINNICASVQQAIIDVLVRKTLKAAKFYKVKSILLGGGVAANDQLRKQLELYATNLIPFVKILIPQKSLCTDNGAMIAAAGFFATPVPWQKITVDPELYY